MEQQERVRGIIAALKDAYPDPFCALHYKKDYELMIAVRLSAQCTDERVNKITPALFARFPTLDAFADADVSEVEEYVRSCGFYKHKARDIVLACQAAARKVRRQGARHNGRTFVPSRRRAQDGKSLTWRYL